MKSIVKSNLFTMS